NGDRGPSVAQQLRFGVMGLGLRRDDDEDGSRFKISNTRRRRSTVGWVERSETHHWRSECHRWVSLRSTHPTIPNDLRRRQAERLRGLHPDRQFALIERIAVLEADCGLEHEGREHLL